MGKCGFEILVLGRRVGCQRPELRDGRCLFHLENKNPHEMADFVRDFVSYVDTALKDRRFKTVDCTGFVFPARKIALSTPKTPRAFKKPLLFTEARIEGALDFSYASFVEMDVDFTRALLTKDASLCFFNSRLESACITFENAEVCGRSFILFSESTFRKGATVECSITGFHDEATIHFDDAKFDDDSGVSLLGTRFYDRTGANFADAVFRGQAWASLHETECHEEASVVFYGAAFRDEAECDLSDAVLGASDFQHLSIDGKASVRFGGVDRPYPQDLSKVHFVHADVTRIYFGNVLWGLDPPGSVADEYSITCRDEETAGASGIIPFRPSYQHVVTLYRGLRQNYERRLRYSEASDFFIREMELLRTRPHHSAEPAANLTIHNRLSRARHHVVSRAKGLMSIAGIYYILAKYGEDYRRVSAWCFASILLYPILRCGPALLSLSPECISLYLTQTAYAFRLFFQLSDLQTLDFPDAVFRLWSALLLALLFISLRRKFERRP